MSYECEKCKKSFELKGALTRHSKRCSDKIIHQCPVEHCKKIFSQSSQLKAHHNVHTKNKPYVCGRGTCKSRFGDPSSKTRHIKEIHTITKANVCLICGTKIKRNSAFNAHLKKHKAALDNQATKRARQLPTHRTVGTPSNYNGITTLPNTYAFDQSQLSMQLSWPSSSHPTSTPFGSNNYPMYSRTRTDNIRPEAPADPPLAIDPALLQRDKHTFTFFDNSSYLSPSAGYDSPTKNYHLRDGAINGYDAYSAQTTSSLEHIPYPTPSPSNYWWLDPYNIFLDPAFYIGLGSLGHGASVMPLTY